MKQILSLLSIVIVLTACSISRGPQHFQLTDSDRALADSILAYALDHEALYTLTDTLKPISSVKLLRFEIAKDSTMKDGDAVVVVKKDSLLQLIERYHRVCESLSGGDWKFILMPFNRTDKEIRNLEIYVVRKSVFMKKLSQQPAFWGQWGFTPGSDPAVVLPVIEYETRYDRNRGYGYLFGYPDYAVDFFVSAQITQATDTAHKLVPRDFFAIPVYAGNKGYFTYAIPKGQQPLAGDSTLYFNARATLERYKLVRERYKTSNGIRSMELWKAMRKEL